MRFFKKGYISAPLKSSVKILVTDDDDTSRMLTCTWLEELGFSYEKADSGAEAFVKFKTGEFPVILMDIEMHTMDGHETATLIRKFERSENLKPSIIIALSAHSILDEKDRYLQSGMDDYIAKPINSYELHERLMRYAM